jgi:hypothetical protein
MKSATELLMRIIANETKYIESMRHTLKEDELTILRLQNKARVLAIEIEERKKLVEEYRVYLKDISETTKARMKLVSSTRNELEMDSACKNIKLIKNLEKEY